MQLLIECVDDLQQVANPNPDPDPDPKQESNTQQHFDRNLTLP